MKSTDLSMENTLLLSARRRLVQRVTETIGRGLLLIVTSVSTLAVLFIFFYIAHDAFPFFQARGFREFFTSTQWYPSMAPYRFGVLAIFYGSLMVTLGAVLVAVPLGVAAAVCLSDVLPFGIRQAVKPVIEILAAIPSVAYGFFALVVFAPLLQEQGHLLLRGAWWTVSVPVAVLAALALADLGAGRFPTPGKRMVARAGLTVLLLAVAYPGLAAVAGRLAQLTISSGANALNVSIILGIMALPTVVSVSEDALQAVGRELREGSYALGATRAETIVRTIIPAASSGILAAILLGIMRALGETMVVWMASGNAAAIPEPWYSYLQPIRTLTATIAGDMGEADHVTGSDRYHVLFAMGLCLLLFSFACNLTSEWVVRRQRKKLRGE